MKTAKVITLAEICKTRKINPKVARSKLRRAIASDTRVQPVSDARWAWPINKKALVEKYISD